MFLREANASPKILMKYVKAVIVGKVKLKINYKILNKLINNSNFQMNKNQKS